VFNPMRNPGHGKRLATSGEGRPCWLPSTANAPGLRHHGGISGMRNKVLKRTPQLDNAPIEFGLALSLIPFIKASDDKLPREQFLRLVMDRIVNDLSSPLAK
jgi:hypothetical protein